MDVCRFRADRFTLEEAVAEAGWVMSVVFDCFSGRVSNKMVLSNCKRRASFESLAMTDTKLTQETP